MINYLIFVIPIVFIEYFSDWVVSNSFYLFYIFLISILNNNYGEVYGLIEDTICPLLKLLRPMKLYSRLCVKNFRILGGPGFKYPPPHSTTPLPTTLLLLVSSLTPPWTLSCPKHPLGHNR